MKLKNLLVLSVFFAAFISCSKVENTEDKDDKYCKLIIYGETSAQTKAHWNDVNGVYKFSWDKTTIDNADMLTTVFEGNNFISWDSYENCAMTTVTPRENDAKRALLTPINKLPFGVYAGSKVYNIAPINGVNGSTILDREALTSFKVYLKMPNSFVNEGANNLKSLKDYSYIYSESVVSKELTADETETIFKSDNAVFKTVPSFFKMAVKNSLNNEIKVNRLYVRALKNSVEEKLFPNMLVYEATKSGVTISEDATQSGSYYSTLKVNVNSSEILNKGSDNNYYLALLPKDGKDSFKGVNLEFTVYVSIGNKDYKFLIIKSLDKLQSAENGAQFVAGSIYTFNLELKEEDKEETILSHQDGDVELYMKSTKPKYSTFIVSGDGYRAEDLAKGGKMETDMNMAIDSLFKIEPFATYKEYFQVYKVYAESVDSGVSGYTSSGYKERNTKFSARYTGQTSTLFGWDDRMAEAYAAKVPNFNLSETPNSATMLILVNDTKYAGTCNMYSNGFSVSLCPMNHQTYQDSYTGIRSNFKNVVAHEFGGHGFGRFADEYTTPYSGSVPQENIDALISNQRSGDFLNLSATNDSTKVGWKEFFTKPGYEHVGIYEGGYYYPKGVWRSEEYSCMKSNITYYSAYCRYIQYMRIKKTAGESYSLDDFISRDKPEPWKPAPLSKSNYVEIYEDYPPLAPPRYKKVF